MKQTEMKNLRTGIRIIFFIYAITQASTVLLAQQEEVRVVKPYSPTLSAAEKIQLLPSLDEDIEYDYDVLVVQDSLTKHVNLVLDYPLIENIKFSVVTF